MADLVYLLSHGKGYVIRCVVSGKDSKDSLDVVCI